MRTTLRAARRGEQRLARDRVVAYHDARALALELGRGQAHVPLDPMAAGVVLSPTETAYRQVPVWLFVLEQGDWAAPSWANVLITDQRLLVRFCRDGLVSLPWSGLLGLQIDLSAERVILDYGDGRPIALSGPATPLVAMAGVAFVYGLQALLTHPALTWLRTR